MSVLHQPRHRRPSWMQTESARRIYVQSDFARKVGPNIASEGDPFSYDPEYVQVWEMPKDLWVRLPTRLTAELEGWQAAGAAVITGIKRMEKLDSEAINRGWPDKSRRLFSRSASYASSYMASPVLSTPPSLDTNTSTIPEDLPALHTSFSNTSTHTPHPVIAGDTPPITPQDIKTPDLAAAVTAVAAAELADLNDALTMLPRRASQEQGSVTYQPRFDETAWELYINSYKAELHSLQEKDLVRFQHIGRGIDKLWTQLAIHERHGVLDSAKREFSVWWAYQAEKAEEYSSHVADLEPPDLESLKARRLAQGMTI